MVVIYGNMNGSWVYWGGRAWFKDIRLAKRFPSMIDAARVSGLPDDVQFIEVM